MLITRFELLWILYERERERGNRSRAKMFLTQALKELGWKSIDELRLTLVERLGDQSTSAENFEPFGFMEPPPQPRTLEEYRQAKLWYERRNQRLKWQYRKLAVERKQRSEMLHQMAVRREDVMRLLDKIIHECVALRTGSA